MSWKIDYENCDLVFVMHLATINRLEEIDAMRKTKIKKENIGESGF